MSHFAQLDENNVVLQVIVVHNNELMIDGIESEDAGIVFCKTLFGESTSWKQTSYNASIRKNYAGIGMTYDSGRDAFIAPKCHDVAVLDETTCQWTCEDASHVIIEGE
jgi:hypothetical protein